jgi:hypothetical protein
MHGRLQLLALALLVASNACKCGRAAVLTKAPQIDVSPNPVLFQPLPSGKNEVVVVQVRNVGNQDLHLAQNPSIVEADGDSEYSLGNAFGQDCGGNARQESSRLTLVPGDCAKLVVRYAPQGAADKDDALLVFASDDPDHPSLSVPMGMGEPAHLQICTIKPDGSDDQCDTPTTQPPQVDFGMVAKGQSALRKVRLRNVGKSQLTNVIVYDPDGPAASEYARSSNAPSSLDATQNVDVTVRFSPVSGGQRQSWLQVDSADPARPSVQVPLRGIAQGPALCADPSPMNFGQTDVGKTSEKLLTLSSCGSAPVQLKQVDFDPLSSPAFTAAAALPAPKTLQPGDKLTVAVRFSPLDSGDAQGALLVPNDSQPDQYVPLHGSGYRPPSCHLSASMTTLDFGQVVRGGSAQRDVSVANRGTLNCNLSAVKIVAGSSYFSVPQPPSATIVLKPGDSFAATIQYAPPINDTNSSDSGALEFDSDDPITPQLQITLQGQPVAQAVCKIDVHPEVTANFPNPIPERVLQFGNVAVGRSKTLPVTFTNKGSAACSLSSWHFELGNTTCFPPIIPCPACSNGDCLGYGVGSPGVTTLPPGASTLMNVTFSPKDASQTPFISDVLLYAHTGDPNLASECDKTIKSDNTPGCIAVAMSGQGDISNLQVIPADLDFGLVTLGCKSKTVNVTLYNTGQTSSFTIKSISLDPSSAPFYVQAPPTPFTLAPHAKVAIQVTYKPTLAGRETASLRIESDASNTTSKNPYVTVALSGTGTTDKHQRDTFTQASVPMVDLLFVVDDSSSMSFYQDQLSQQAGAFVNNALKYNADFHMGVSTNDTVAADSHNASYSTKIYPGGLYGQPAVVTQTTPSPANAFSKNIKVGDGFNGRREAGLELAWDVLRAPATQTPPPQGSQGFLRDAARLIVVDVQDDDDESNDSTAFYIDFFKSLKGQYNAGMVSFNAIGGFDDNGKPAAASCNSVDPQAAQRYYEVAQGTGGKTWNICNANWGAIADQLSLGAFSGRKQFPLTRWADPATVVVRLNGAPQTAGKDYTFDQASNSVIFPAAPAPAAVIVADYDALCF